MLHQAQDAPVARFLNSLTEKGGKHEAALVARGRIGLSAIPSERHCPQTPNTVSITSPSGNTSPFAHTGGRGARPVDRAQIDSACPMCVWFIAGRAGMEGKIAGFYGISSQDIEKVMYNSFGQN